MGIYTFPHDGKLKILTHTKIIAIKTLKEVILRSRIILL